MSEAEYQVVVFVRVNNMESFQVEKQETFVVDVHDPAHVAELSDLIEAGLVQAHAQWETACADAKATETDG